MINPEAIDPVLLRQLRRAGLSDPSQAPDAATWEKILRRVGEHYQHMTEEREMLARSLELSTTEMQEENRRVVQEQQLLLALVSALGGTLHGLREAARDGLQRTPEEASSAVKAAKATLVSRLDQLAGQLLPQGREGQLSSEFEHIRQGLSALADQLAQLLTEAARDAQRRKDLEVLGAAERLLLPEAELIDRPAFKLAGYHRATEYGGGWWIAHDLPGGKLLVLVGEAAGRGVEAAIITGAAKAACDLARNLLGERLSAPQLLELMSQALGGLARQQLLMTCLAAVLDPHTRRLSMANAGHRFPLLIRGGAVQPLPCHGAPLGVMLSPSYTEAQVEVAPGDVIFWGTDGVLDCESPQGEKFGPERLNEALRHAAQWEPVAIRDTLRHHLSRFQGEQAHRSDIAFVVAKVGG